MFLKQKSIWYVPKHALMFTPPICDSFFPLVFGHFVLFHYSKNKSYNCILVINIGLGYSVLRHFQQYFSYIVAVTDKLYRIMLY
jgi:hypothetical protein